MIDLDELERKAKAATAGCWEVAGTRIVSRRSDAGFVRIIGAEHCDDTDAAFIAAANPAVVLELIGLLREACSIIDDTDDIEIEWIKRSKAFLAMVK